jgi:hypothetical protein
MSQRDHPQTRPNFDAPIEIVADPSLSKQEKAKALEDLEQEARQLRVAELSMNLFLATAPHSSNRWPGLVRLFTECMAWIVLAPATLALLRSPSSWGEWP